MALAAKNRRTQVGWRSTYDANHVGTAPVVDDVTPDLTALQGWNPAWGLPAGVATSVFVTVFERPSAVGDGKVQRSASKGLEITP
jgi:hypothetical protein